MEKINNLKNILSKIANSLKLTTVTKEVKLLTVSKYRTSDDIMVIYNEGQRDFGENYVNDLVEKSEKLPLDINWHMIGHLQTNKCRKILKVPNLKVIESVDSFKLAEEINTQCEKLGRSVVIYIQINISKESSKSGVMIEDVIPLYEEINEKCKHLVLKGIMALGTLGSEEEFTQLYDLKLKICEKFNTNPDEFILSLGTSDDFEKAILFGSNEVRIGSLVFEI